MAMIRKHWRPSTGRSDDDRDDDDDDNGDDGNVAYNNGD